MTADELTPLLQDLSRQFRSMEAGFVTVNPSMDALNREVYTNASVRLLHSLDNFVVVAFEVDGAPWAGDRIRRAVFGVLRDSVDIVYNQITQGVAFPVVALRISRQHEVFEHIELDAARCALTLLSAPSAIAVQDWVIQRFADCGLPTNDIAAEAGFWPMLASKRGLPIRHWLSYESVAMYEQALEAVDWDIELGSRSATWLGRPAVRAAACRILGLLDDVDLNVRETFLCLVFDWQGTIGELLDAAGSLTFQVPVPASDGGRV